MTCRREQRAWIHDHITRAVRPDDWEAYTGLRPGQTYADIPEHLQRYRTDIFTDKYKRLVMGASCRGRSPRTSRRTATGTSTPSSTARCRSARRRGCRPSRTGSASPGSRATASRRSATPCRRSSAEAVGEALRRSLHRCRPDRASHRQGAREAAGLARRAAAAPLAPRRRSAPGSCSPAELALDRSSPDDLAARDSPRSGRSHPPPPHCSGSRIPAAALIDAGLSCPCRAICGRCR